MALRLGALYFAAIFATGFVLGTIRTLLLLPRIGELAAVAVELPVILAAAWLICGWILRGRHLTKTGAAIMGTTAFILLMMAEAFLSVILSGRTLGEHIELYAEPAQLLGLIGQVTYAAFPLVKR